MIDATRTSPIPMGTLTDNEAVRLAITHAHSSRLGHMKRHAEVSLEFLHQMKADIGRVATDKNWADVFTKALARPAHLKLLAFLMTLNEAKTKIERSTQ